ncbi:MAG: hypothetical protein CML46_05345 [Rhodobacteraceae bacterium]|nr:hypothetical protein [Paracoccaceae bacterium]MBR26354.1 hypothetical protein [Paracoccaceae bacterium]
MNANGHANANANVDGGAAGDADGRVDLIRRYYDGCTSGDLGLLHATLHEDVVHYFLAPNVGSAPVRGRAHLSAYWRKVARMLDARWVVERAVGQGCEVVIEWSMHWTPSPGAPRAITRGAEWFVFRDGLIFEIRSWYQQRPETTELEGFPYGPRGYSVTGREASDLHPGAATVPLAREGG